MHSRRDIQMSLPPSPPGRFEMKYSVCSSGERPAFASRALELTTGPRFTGSDHSELAKDMAWSLVATGSDPDWHATSSATERSGVRLVMTTGFIETSSLMCARRAGRHPDVGAAGTTRPAGGKQQDAAVCR